MKEVILSLTLLSIFAVIFIYWGCILFPLSRISKKASEDSRKDYLKEQLTHINLDNKTWDGVHFQYESGRLATIRQIALDDLTVDELERLFIQVREVLSNPYKRNI